ncbi:hypothetical protein ACU635_37405 [[Actinomadura] parvosata]|uniref:hypothetical protein n=1 Tax=[Actinomadura] parvosata TaxID=1955412 RepID=UPI00406CD477
MRIAKNSACAVMCADILVSRRGCFHISLAGAALTAWSATVLIACSATVLIACLAPGK